jgi:predicted Zn-dependent peptidase
MISKQFELLGATVEAHVSEADFIISISSFSKHLSEVLHLLAEIIRDAEFQQAELDLVKKHELNSMEAALQDHDRVLSAAHEYVLYGRDTFGKLGSRSAIRDMTREHVMAYFGSVRSCPIVFCTAITDLSREHLLQHLDVILAARPTDGFTLRPEKHFRNSSGSEAVIVHSAGASNDRLRWSHRGLTASDERRFDLSLIIDGLGSFEGFLFDQLRNRRGWCYGAYASVMQPTTRPGRVAYYADPSAETSDKLIPEMLRLLHTFPDESDFKQRLAERNETFKNRYAYQLEIKKKLWNEVNRDRYGIPILDRGEYVKRIDAVNYSTARKVIGEVFDLRNLTMVFYGDADRLQKILHHAAPGITPVVLGQEVLTS